MSAKTEDVTAAINRLELAAARAERLDIFNADTADAADLRTLLASHADLVEEVRELKDPMYCQICKSCGSDGCGCEHKCIYAHSHPDVVKDMAAQAERIASLEAFVSSYLIEAEASGGWKGDEDLFSTGQLLSGKASA